jgi:hypothetical protein
MEAIAAFALACNVVQVVDFSLKIVSKYKEIYNEGTTLDHQDLDYTSKHLAEISEKLNKSILDTRTTRPRNKDDSDLQDLAIKVYKGCQ